MQKEAELQSPFRSLLISLYFLLDKCPYMLSSSAAVAGTDQQLQPSHSQLGFLSLNCAYVVDFEVVALSKSYTIENCQGLRPEHELQQVRQANIHMYIYNTMHLHNLGRYSGSDPSIRCARSDPDDPRRVKMRSNMVAELAKASSCPHRFRFNEASASTRCMNS
jgi:hypothetical protein